MKNKRAGLIGKMIFIIIALFIFLVIIIKYPEEGKVIIQKLAKVIGIGIHWLVIIIGWVVKQIAT